jgi:hypothetical protein
MKRQQKPCRYEVSQKPAATDENAQLAPSEQSLTKECGSKDGDRGGSAQSKPTNQNQGGENHLDAHRPSHGGSWPVISPLANPRSLTAGPNRMLEQGLNLFLVILQDAVASDRIAQCASDKDIGGKVR